MLYVLTSCRYMHKQVHIVTWMSSRVAIGKYSVQCIANVGKLGHAIYIIYNDIC